MYIHVCIVCVCRYWHKRSTLNPSPADLTFPHGVLLYGPPGVGKSLLAHALSNETTAHSLHLSASELLLDDPNSEGKIQEVFAEAREQ